MPEGNDQGNEPYRDEPPLPFGDEPTLPFDDDSTGGPATMPSLRASNHPHKPFQLVHGDAKADRAWILAGQHQARAAAACKPDGVAVYCVDLQIFIDQTAPDGLDAIFDKSVLIFPGGDASVALVVYESAAALGRFCEDEGAAEVEYVRFSRSLDKYLHGRNLADQQKRLAVVAKRTDKKPATAKPKPNITPKPTATPAAAPKITKWTDSGVAERWVESVEGRWCWSKAAGFMEWDGRGWAERTDAEAVESLRRFGKAEVVTAVGDLGADDAKLAVQRLDARQLKAAMSLAKGQMVVDLADFDQDPDIAVAPNGVIDLQTSALLPHDAARLVTKCCGVDYVAGATHPDWDQVLTSVPPEVADYLQIRFGQMLTGHVPDDDVMLVLRGGGENAKTTQISAIRRAFGDYAVLLGDKVLLGDTRDHSTELMPLRGSRMAYIEELPEARHLNTQRLKKINGSEEVTARHVHKDNVTFKATWGLGISTNFDVLVEETDHGTWRRLQEIRYPYTYKKAHEPLMKPTDRHGDPRLRDAVRHGKEQQRAVLAWLVEGARIWYENGCVMPQPPEQVEADTRRWRKANDQVLAFAEDHLVVDPESAVWIDDLHAQFGEWLRGRSHNAWALPKMRSRFSDNEWLQESGAYFTGRERRDPATLSRPSATLGSTPQKPAPAQGQYLVGARFRTQSDELADVKELRSQGFHAPALAELEAARAAYAVDVDAWRQRAAAEAGVSADHVEQHTFGLRDGFACNCMSVTRPSHRIKDLRRASRVIDKRLNEAWKRCAELGALSEDEFRSGSAPDPNISRVA